MVIGKIVSGGQTGVDRAALDVALEMGVPGSGWCPKGRNAEDGPLDPRYPLTETPQARPAQRTRWNVRDSDGTLIVARGKLTGGTALTQRAATTLGKPSLLVDPGDPDAVDAILAWVHRNRIAVLNVAGPRESHCRGIYDQTVALLRAVLEKKSRSDEVPK